MKTRLELRRLRTWFFFGGVGFAGCTSVGPDYEPPSMPLPASFYAGAHLPASSPAGNEGLWWSQLGSPMLDALVTRATAEGLDLRVGMARLRAARAERAVAAAEHYPKLDATLSYAQTGDSENTQFGGFVRDRDLWSIGLDASWELDLFGRIDRLVEAADADYEASWEELRALYVSIAAETARHFVERCAFQRRLELAQKNVELQLETLALVRARYEAGLVGERDLAQASTIVESTRALLPILESGLRQSEHRLAVLVGQAPGEWKEEFASAHAIPVPPAQLALGVPAEMLRRRADVRRAERQLAAATARIGLAEADLYPRLSLSGSLGLASEQLENLLEGDSTFFRVGPSLGWKVFDANRTRWGIELQDARAAEAHALWQQSVLRALEECENALVAYAEEGRRQAALTRAVEQAENALALAETQYREGLSDFQSVLDSSRALTVLEDELALSKAALTLHWIALYKALGGGWQTELPEPANAPPNETAPTNAAEPGS